MAMIVGIDIGGTFTDLLLFDEESGEIRVSKISSTPRDQSVGLLRGLEKLEVPISRIGTIVHGTTVGTNAILERKGARIGLLTTKGFRDVIELRRRDRPSMYGLHGTFQPLVPREDRMEVDERTDFMGAVLKRVEKSEVERLGRDLLSKGIQSVVVSYLHSYANPENEERTQSVLKTFWPNDYIVLSSEILPEFREFERTSTTAISAYIQPLLSRYLDSLSGSLEERGYQGQILIVNSNGGTMSMDVSKRYAVQTILSGPAAGVVAASHIAMESGHENIISFDMGGTSLDVSLIPNGKPNFTTESKIGYGLPILTSMIDIKTIGAGGGSIAWLDGAGVLSVGPHSAGSDPGPACYGKGGEEPTVTDANLLLGRINSQAPIEKELILDLERSRKAISRTIAEPLHLSVEDAAQAIIRVANHKMGSSIRTVSIERGYDPRDFVLVCFGGAGPLHAASLLREFNFSKILIPLFPGITSAMGCIISDLRHDFVQTVNQRLDQLDGERVKAVLEGLAARGRALLEEERMAMKGVEIFYEADMVYEGQTHGMRTPLSKDRLDPTGLAEAFQKNYQTAFSKWIDIPVKLVNLRATVLGIRPKISCSKLFDLVSTDSAPTPREERSVYFDGRWISSKIYDRHKLPKGAILQGPCILEQIDTTILVEPGTKVKVDAYGNIVMEVC